MLHVITLFTVPDNEDAFVRSLRMNGDWQISARRTAPDLVGTDLLRHQLSPLYLCHDFRTCPVAYYRAIQCPAVQRLLVARRVLAESAFELGAFSFPALVESLKVLRTGFKPVMNGGGFGRTACIGLIRSSFTCDWTLPILSDECSEGLTRRQLSWLNALPQLSHGCEHHHLKELAAVTILALGEANADSEVIKFSPVPRRVWLPEGDLQGFEAEFVKPDGRIFALSINLNSLEYPAEPRGPKSSNDLINHFDEHAPKLRVPMVGDQNLHSMVDRIQVPEDSVADQMRIASGDIQQSLTKVDCTVPANS